MSAAPDPIRAYDMGRFQRVVRNDGPRVSGRWNVLSTKKPGEDSHLVEPVDVVIWGGEDENPHAWGTHFSDNHFSARVTDGVVDLRPFGLRDNENRRAIVQQYMAELEATILAVARAARYQDEDPA